MQVNCQNCGVRYQVVHIGVESVETNHQTECLACGAPLQGRDGRFVLKYFLLQPSLRPLGRRRAGLDAPSQLVGPRIDRAYVNERGR